MTSLYFKDLIKCFKDVLGNQYPIIDKKWAHSNNNLKHFIFGGLLKSCRIQYLMNFHSTSNCAILFSLNKIKIFKKPIYLLPLCMEDFFNLFSHFPNLTHFMEVKSAMKSHRRILQYSSWHKLQESEF